MLRHDKRLSHLFWLILAAALPAAQAQTQAPASTPAGAPVELAADSAEVDDDRGVSTYRGDVVLTRGTLRITGDQMRVFTNTERQLQRIVVDGTPATYREVRPDAPARRAEAPRMEYYASGPERLVLLEGGRLWQGDDSVTGQTITHYPAENRTVADGAGGGDGRVNVRVLPAPDGEQ